jgi:hypothetical protein
MLATLSISCVMALLLGSSAGVPTAMSKGKAPPLERAASKCRVDARGVRDIALDQNQRIQRRPVAESLNGTSDGQTRRNSSRRPNAM